MDWNSCLVQGVPTLGCLPIVFSNILSFLFMISGTIDFLVILYSGIRFILAGGDAKKLDGARKTFTYAIIGLILLLLSFLILNIIAVVTGVKCIVLFSPFAKGITIGHYTYTNCTK